MNKLLCMLAVASCAFTACSKEEAPVASYADLKLVFKNTNGNRYRVMAYLNKREILRKDSLHPLLADTSAMITGDITGDKYLNILAYTDNNITANSANRPLLVLAILNSGKPAGQQDTIKLEAARITEGQIISVPDSADVVISQPHYLLNVLKKLQ